MATITTCEDNVNALGSVAGRLGYTFGRALFYGKGGWAFGEVSAGMHANNPNYGTLSYPAASSTRWENDGWTAGGGMEIALTDTWSAKAEYMHYEFPNNTFTIQQSPGGPVQRYISAAGDSVKVGVNYHLGQIGAGDTQPALK